MTDPMRYAERLAALLDGRVDEQERARLLELLAASDPAFAAFVDAAAVQAAAAAAAATDSEPEAQRTGADPTAAVSARADPDPAAGARRGAPHRQRRIGWVVPVTIAAGIGAIALAIALLARGTATPPTDPHRIAALLAPRGAAAGAWTADAWTTTRAEGDPLTPERRAVRIGALLVALELAVRESRPQAAGIAAEVAASFGSVAAAAPVARIYAQIRDRPADAGNAELLATGSAAVSRLLPADWLAAGAWLEAARVAARSRDVAFFARPASRRALDRVRALRALPPVAAAALTRVAAATPPAPSSDWAALESDLTTALRALAS